MDNLQVVNLGITILLSLVAFFGGSMLNGLSQAIKDLRNDDRELRDKMDSFVRVDVLEAWRKEQREISTRIFDKLEVIQREVGGKVSREECGVCRSGKPQ